MQLLKSILWIWVLLLLQGAQGRLVAQNYPPINEKAFLNSKWRFTYAAHVPSDEVTFRAEDGYTHYIWFKYDGSCQTFFNGNLTTETWALDKDKVGLQYNFSSIQQWQIAEYSKELLALEFKMGESAYRYYFVRAEDQETPFFEYGMGEVPEAQVNKVIKGKDPHPYRYLKDEDGKRFRQDNAKDKGKKDEKTEEPPLEFMQIELVGGGFFGGPNPAYRNHIVIKTDGRVIKELQTELGGLQVWKSKISRKHLEELILYVEKQDFFGMNQIYTCNNNDCMTRLRELPRPIALRLAITKGSQRKVVTISIWEGLGKNEHWVAYPKSIDLIIKAIEDVTMMSLNN